MTKEGVIIRDVESGKGKFSADLGTSQEVRPGDLVFCLFDVPETPRTVGLSRHHGMITGAYTVFECRVPSQAPYIDYFYRAMDDRKLLAPLYSGLRNTIPPPRFLGAKTPIPSLQEQAAIVRFLNYADRSIRSAVAAKRKLIALLTEQKQALVYEAVTKGLHSGGRVKPSGIPGLGDVPNHWAVVLNQRIFKEVTRSHNEQPETPLSLSQRQGLVESSAMRERSLQTSSYANWKVTVPGDLVVNRFKAHLGVFFASTLRGMVSFHYGVFVPRANICTKYYELLFHTAPYRSIYAGRSNGMTVGLQNLSNQNFYNVHSPVPPLMEQGQIVAFAEAATHLQDAGIERARAEIRLLREYHASLIANVVTGALDVRQAAVSLPGDIDMSESVESDDDDGTESADLHEAPDSEEAVE
ncbi:MAG: restriction endonuclease subunit S [Rhodoglobus sp.]